jgi:hypothetical protein
MKVPFSRSAVWTGFTADDDTETADATRCDGDGAAAPDGDGHAVSGRAEPAADGAYDRLDRHPPERSTPLCHRPPFGSRVTRSVVLGHLLIGGLVALAGAPIVRYPETSYAVRTA